MGSIKLAPKRLGSASSSRLAIPVVSRSEKRADPFYLSPQWKALMRHLIGIRGRRCEDPEHDKAKPSEGVRIYGDHVIEIEDGGPLLDPNNILLRCGPCHGRKTAKARAARVHGGVGGLNL